MKMGVSHRMDDIRNVCHLIYLEWGKVCNLLWELQLKTISRKKKHREKNVINKIVGRAVTCHNT